MIHRRQTQLCFNTIIHFNEFGELFLLARHLMCHFYHFAVDWHTIISLFVHFSHVIGKKPFHSNLFFFFVFLFALILYKLSYSSAFIFHCLLIQSFYREAVALFC